MWYLQTGSEKKEKEKEESFSAYHCYRTRAECMRPAEALAAVAVAGVQGVSMAADHRELPEEAAVQQGLAAVGLDRVRPVRPVPP